MFFTTFLYFIQNIFRVIGCLERKLREKKPIYVQMWFWFPLSKYISIWRFTICFLPAIPSYEKKIWYRKLQSVAPDTMTQWSNVGPLGICTNKFPVVFLFFNATLSPLMFMPTNGYIYLHINITFWKCDIIKFKTSDSSTSFVTQGSKKILWAQDVPGGW